MITPLHSALLAHFERRLARSTQTADEFDTYSLIEDNKLVAVIDGLFCDAAMAARELSKVGSKCRRNVAGQFLAGTLITVWSGPVRYTGSRLCGITSHVKYMCGLPW